MGRGPTEKAGSADGESSSTAARGELSPPSVDAAGGDQRNVEAICVFIEFLSESTDGKGNEAKTLRMDETRHCGPQKGNISEEASDYGGDDYPSALQGKRRVRRPGLRPLDLTQPAPHADLMCDACRPLLRCSSTPGANAQPVSASEHRYSVGNLPTSLMGNLTGCLHAAASWASGCPAREFPSACRPTCAEPRPSYFASLRQPQRDLSPAPAPTLARAHDNFPVGAPAGPQWLHDGHAPSRQAPGPEEPEGTVEGHGRGPGLLR